MTWGTASSVLDTAGFTGRREQFAQVPAATIVVSQSPQPGTVIGKADSVQLTFYTEAARPPHSSRRTTLPPRPGRSGRDWTQDVAEALLSTTGGATQPSLHRSRYSTRLDWSKLTLPALLEIKLGKWLSASNLGASGGRVDT